MSVPWPAELPQKILYDGFEEQFPNNLIRSNPDMGPPKTRRRTSVGFKPFKANMVLTTAQTLIFDSFFKDSIMDGAEPFELTHPRTGELITLQVGASPPTYRPAGPGRWLLALDLIILT